MWQKNVKILVLLQGTEDVSKDAAGNLQSAVLTKNCFKTLTL
jgi:hypothetical protein